MTWLIVPVFTAGCRSIRQAGLDVGYQNYLDEREYPWQRLTQYQALIEPSTSFSGLVGGGSGGAAGGGSKAQAVIGGAAAGAGAGMALGPYGAVAGGVLGGVAGLMGR